MMRKAWMFIKTYYAMLVVLGVFIWAALAIVYYRGREHPEDAIILRIGHWQLEASVREALNQMAEEYREINPRVYIIQDAVPEMVYPQWTTTQLMGGTAPDILEVGLGALPRHLWIQYYNRYCVPLTRYVNQPNPYNEGTDLEGVPLRNTFKDGMRSCYVEEMQEYVSIPLSQFGVRIFYNRDLLKKLTGLSEPPSDYRSFLKVCEQIESHTNERGEPFTAIASSKYHLPMWEAYMMDPLTFGAVRRADFNRDGFVGNDELFVAFRTGRVDFDFPPYKARYQMLREISDHFQTGYTGLNREEAVFLFAQQNAVFMTTGTWDARSLEEQAEGRFEVGVMDFPLPTPEDPYYGDIIEGPLYEQAYSGFPFAITRTSKHPEVALDFLLFMAGKYQNEKLNRIIGWIPSVKGTEMDPLLKAFEPHLEGVYKAMDFNLGGESWLKYIQQYSLYQIGDSTYEEFANEFAPFYKKQGLKDFLEQQRDWRRSMHKNEVFLAAIRAAAFLSEGEEKESNWIKYRSLTTQRQVWPEINHSRQMQLVHEGPQLGSVGPYEYSEDVLQRVRKRIAKELQTQP